MYLAERARAQAPPRHQAMAHASHHKCDCGPPPWRQGCGAMLRPGPDYCPRQTPARAPAPCPSQTMFADSPPAHSPRARLASAPASAARSIHDQPLASYPRPEPSSAPAAAASGAGGRESPWECPSPASAFPPRAAAGRSTDPKSSGRPCGRWFPGFPVGFARCQSRPAAGRPQQASGQAPIQAGMPAFSTNFGRYARSASLFCPQTLQADASA